MQRDGFVFRYVDVILVVSIFAFAALAEFLFPHNREPKSLVNNGAGPVLIAALESGWTPGPVPKKPGK